MSVSTLAVDCAVSVFAESTTVRLSSDGVSIMATPDKEELLRRELETFVSVLRQCATDINEYAFLAQCLEMILEMKAE